MFTKICVTILIYLCFFCSSIFCKKNEYGPYDIVWEKYEICKGPKQSCGEQSVSNTKTNMSDVIFRMKVDKDCALTMVKIIINQRIGNTTKNIRSLNLNKPCEHYFLGPLLQARFNMTKACKIDKGSYEHHVNVAGLATSFLGPSFFYGVYTFKTLVYNRMSYLACYDAVIVFKKKGKLI